MGSFERDMVVVDVGESVVVSDCVTVKDSDVLVEGELVTDALVVADRDTLADTLSDRDSERLMVSVTLLVVVTERDRLWSSGRVID